MDKSTSYDEWREAAVQHDEISGCQKGEPLNPEH